MKYLARIALAAGALSVSLSAMAGFDYGAATDFNVYTFGNFTAQHGDTQGRLAVGGNLSIANFGVIEPAGHPHWDSLTHGSVGTALVVGGNASIKDSTIYLGDAVINQSATLNNTTFNRDLAVNQGGSLTRTTVKGELISPTDLRAGNSIGSYTQGTQSLTQDFNAAQTYFTDYSTTLSTYNTTGKISYSEVESAGDPYLLTLTGNSANSQVFNLSADDLINAYDISLLGVNTGSSVLINVSGDIASLTAMGPHDSKGSLLNVNSIFQNQDIEILFNFYDATELTLSDIGIYGTVLAPLADVEANSGRLTGKLITNNYYSDGNFQFDWDVPTTPLIPEPSTYLLMLIGLLSVGWMTSRRRSQ